VADVDLHLLWVSWGIDLVEVETWRIEP